ncbi:MAG: ubiquinol-cytochrome c reductase iron-sulfur subunit [Gammaproteobacteria bacterium]|nr:ubiquinol-cytochrome c reductase iron-sulfur subunit [Gammaproteobacteria bacterium]
MTDPGHASAAIAVAQDVDDSRRRFLTLATAATGAVGVVFAAVPFVASWKPSERARALGAPTEVDLAQIEPGQLIVTSWRKQPIYIVRRTPEMVASLAGIAGRLKDPESRASRQPAYADNVMRSRTEEFLVLIGTCTHLGCLPKARFTPGTSAELGANWPGGFFCPCHGSRFDMAGRVFDGSPASVNLVVPPYAFAGQRMLVIGVDDAKGAA